jgi:hypothetical protein
MKRTALVLPALAVIAGVSACGSSGSHPAARHSVAQVASDAPAPSAAPTPPPPPPPRASPSPTPSAPGQSFVAGVENDSTAYYTDKTLGDWPSNTKLINLRQSICTAVEQAGSAVTVTDLNGQPTFSDLGISAEQMVDLAEAQVGPQTITG